MGYPAIEVVRRSINHSLGYLDEIAEENERNKYRHTLALANPARSQVSTEQASLTKAHKSRKRSLLGHLTHLDEYTPSFARLLNNMSNLCFYLGGIASLGRFVPIHPVPLFAHALSTVSNLAGYCFWRFALSLETPKHKLCINQNALQLQHTLSVTPWHRKAAVIGIAATLVTGLVLISPAGSAAILMAIGAWLYTGSSAYTATAANADLENAIKTDDKTQYHQANLKAKSHYAAYCNTHTLTCAILALGATLSLVFPPLAAAIFVVTVALASIPVITACIDMVQYQYHKPPTRDKINTPPHTKPLIPSLKTHQKPIPVVQGRALKRLPVFTAESPATKQLITPFRDEKKRAYSMQNYGQPIIVNQRLSSVRSKIKLE